MYLPLPSCPAEAFSDIISRSQALIISISSPLPNVIMLGDFNFPDINWTNPDMSCQYAIPFISLSDCLFLKPTHRSNFLPHDFINPIDVTDSGLSDHCIITRKRLSRFATLLLFANPQTVFVMLLSHLISGKLIGQVFFPLLDCIASECLPVITETLSDLCSINVPLKCHKSKYVSKFHRERKILMRKRTKLKKTSPQTLSVQSKLVSIERDLISSQQKEKMFEESLAVTKIKSD